MRRHNEINGATMTVISISVGEEMNPSRRNTMEDSHVIHGPGTWKSPDPNMTYFAVHDGHGGERVCEDVSHEKSVHLRDSLFPPYWC